MTPHGEGRLFQDVLKWLDSIPGIKAAVLYGSTARSADGNSAYDKSSDIDLHIIASYVSVIHNVNWSQAFPDQRFCFRIRRSATGNTNKVSVVFESGRIDIIVLPWTTMLMARWALFFQLHRYSTAIQSSFDEMATSMRPGYRFLKGGGQWIRFYQRIVSEFPGVRLSDEAMRGLADVFLADVLLAATRIRRGELVAAQHALHRDLVDTNLRLARELHLRRGSELRSFGLGRRAESLMSATELPWVAISARLQAPELMCALAAALNGMKMLMSYLVPDWTVPPTMEPLLKEELRELR